MNIALVGLGKMGIGIASRLLADKHAVFGFDYNTSAMAAAKDIGIQCAKTMDDLAMHARIFWLMVPAGKPVDDVIDTLLPVLQSGDIVIDGGNSFFKDSQRRSDLLAKHNILFLDCGTSGGIHGASDGYCLMIGGKKEAFEKVQPLLVAIAAPVGIIYTGPSGSGHYVKMVHNGIEYALLQAYAEGFHVLKEGSFNDLPLADIANTWNHGSIVRSWLLQLLGNVLQKDSQLADISGQIGENKTGQWTAQEAQDKNIPVPTIEKSLEVRAWSRLSGGNYATKLVSLLRHEFGGHRVKRIDEKE